MTGAPAAIFELKDLEYTYPDSGRPALALESLTIPSGRVVALCGPNGAGKSTLLYVLALLFRPQQGRITYAGQDVWALSREERRRARRTVAVVHQDPYLFRTSVGQNVAYGLKVRGWPREQRRRRAEEVLDWVGLSGFASRPVGPLSGGQRQRVALARALAVGPRVLLLDEPTASLDLAARRRFLGLLRRLVEGRDLTIVWASHDLDQVEGLAEEKIFLHRGSVLLGDSKNLWPGRLCREGEETWFETRGWRMPIAAPDGAGQILCLDPDRLLLRPVETPAPQPALQGTITGLRLLGSGLEVTVSGPVVLQVHLQGDPPPGLKLRLGEPVLCLIPPEAVQLL